MKTAEISRSGTIIVASLAALAAALAIPSAAQAPAGQTIAPRYTYVDLVELGQAANLVLKAQIRRQSTLGPERSPGLKPGWVRLYLEADTMALYSGQGAIGSSQRLLADFPLDAKGKPPKLKDTILIFFGRSVPGKPGELQLLEPDSYLDPAEEERVRNVLRQLAAPDRPPQITGVREALSIAGNLAGESETQLFLETRNGAPVSISVTRRPGMAPQWGVAWSEIVDQSARPPERETLAWYSLVCSLPFELPASANLSADEASRRRAVQDYKVVIDELGFCRRNRE